MRRRVLWMLPSGLYLLGSRSEDRRNLMTLNWATQLALDPKLIGVSVERSSLSHRLVSDGAVFALSILPRSERSVVRRFVKPAEEGPEPGQLNGFAVQAATTGAPIWTGSLAWVDCRVRDQLVCGDHTLFVGEVVDAGSSPTATEGDATVEVLRMEDTRMNYGG